MSRKRSIEVEHSTFQENWELQYFVFKENNKILCLMRKNSIAVYKEYNIERHHDTINKENHNRYIGKPREDKMSEFMLILHKE